MLIMWILYWNLAEKIGCKLPACNVACKTIISEKIKNKKSFVAVSLDVDVHRMYIQQLGFICWIWVFKHVNESVKILIN